MGGSEDGLLLKAIYDLFKQHGVKIHQERASCQYTDRINSTISQNAQIYTYLWERQNLQ